MDSVNIVLCGEAPKKLQTVTQPLTKVSSTTWSLEFIWRYLPSGG
jgi:hypothetical protein